MQVAGRPVKVGWPTGDDTLSLQVLKQQLEKANADLRALGWQDGRQGFMTARGIEFLENWIEKNVTAGGPPDDPLTASVIAKRCIVEAAAEGITVEDLTPNSGSVESHIAEAMVHLAGPRTSGD